MWPVSGLAAAFPPPIILFLESSQDNFVLLPNVVWYLPHPCFVTAETDLGSSALFLDDRAKMGKPRDLPKLNWGVRVR